MAQLSQPYLRTETAYIIEEIHNPVSVFICVLWGYNKIFVHKNYPFNIIIPYRPFDIFKTLQYTTYIRICQWFYFTVSYIFSIATNKTTQSTLHKPLQLSGMHFILNWCLKFSVVTFSTSA